jgi:hypothetical protein
MSEKNKPLAVGQLKESSLLKRIPEVAVRKILSEYVKKKTGRVPEVMNTFSGVIMQCEQGKIFFRNGEIEFEPSPFHVKKVKSWFDEMKSFLKFYASKIYLAEVKKVIQEEFNVLKEQELDNGGFILELSSPNETKKESVLRIIVTPGGRVAVFPAQDRTESLESQAYQVIKALESRGLLDF